MSGQEVFEQAQVGAEVTHKIRTRWRDGVTPKDRISYGGRTFNIQSILNTRERGVEAVLLCKEEV
jgi:SPP1 family predicted phage head-tail adaptor